MNERQAEWIIGLFITLCILVTADIYNQSVGCDSCKMRGFEYENGIGGYSSTDEYYCVWTKGKENETINRVIKHEAVHQFIHREPQHFCKRYLNRTFKKCNSFICTLYEFEIE